MAKQKGIHQIKGKVGDMSYYQTAGVPGGLIRRIPEGLSNRVKTADEYANTRLNNDEFKNASGIATFAFNAVPSRKSSMMRRFAVAAMIKEALQYIKEGSGNWGQRIPSATFDNILVDLLENHSKSGPYAGEFGTVSTSVAQSGSIAVTIGYDETDAARLSSLGIDGWYIINVNGAMAEKVEDGLVREIFGHTNPTPQNVVLDPQGSSDDFGVTISPVGLGLSATSFIEIPSVPNNGMFTVITFVPYRQINSQRHTLYEYATFVCVPLGPVPQT